MHSSPNSAELTSGYRSKNPFAVKARIRKRIKKQNAQAARGKLTEAPTRTYLRAVEKSLKGKISMRKDRNNEITLSLCNPQSQSPLFAKLDFDVRDRIFDLVLSPHDHDIHTYKESTSYHRPGYHAPHRIDQALLFTCRLAWLENFDKPAKNTTHTFWFSDGPPGTTFTAQQFSDHFRRMSATTLGNLRHVHVFAGCHWAEQLFDKALFSKLFGHPSFCPKITSQLAIHCQSLTLHCTDGTKAFTLRHKDFREWDTARPLTLHHAWIQQLLDDPIMTRIPRLEVELETTVDRAEELIAIVEGLEALQSKANADEEEAMPGFGDSLTDQTQYQLLKDKAQMLYWSKAGGPNGEMIDYVVAKLVWLRKAADIAEPHDPSFPEETRKQRKRRERLDKYFGHIVGQDAYADQQMEAEVKGEGAVEEPPKKKKRRAKRRGRRDNGGVLYSPVKTIDPLDIKRSYWLERFHETLLFFTPRPTVGEWQ